MSRGDNTEESAKQALCLLDPAQREQNVQRVPGKRAECFRLFQAKLDWLDLSECPILHHSASEVSQEKLSVVSDKHKE